MNLNEINIIKDPAIEDGKMCMVNFIFTLATTTKEKKSLYCSYEHEYSIRSVARDLGFFSRKAPVIKKIQIKFIKNYGQANQRNHDQNRGQGKTE